MSLRISTYWTNQVFVNEMNTVQKRVNDFQSQAATGQKAQQYQGIGIESHRLINLENERDKLKRYVQDNSIADLRLHSQETAVDAIEKIVRTMRNSLVNPNLDLTNGITPEEASTIENLQNQAFQAMKEIEGYLNTQVDGNHLFAGGRVDTEPVNFSYGTLSEFQTAFDGSDIVYPTTRAAHMSSLTTAFASTGNLSFDNATGRITAVNAGSLSAIPVGSTITVASSTSNDGRYTVLSNDGTNVTVSPALTNEVAAGATLSTDSYYEGDQLESTHRVDNTRNITLGINASDGAFEKAFRAFGIIAQGDLANNPDRIATALGLLNDSLRHDATNLPAESSSDLGDLVARIADNRVVLDRAGGRHQKDISYLEQQVGDLKGVDTFEVVTKLNHEMNALQISFQTLGRIQRLSLADYL